MTRTPKRKDGSASIIEDNGLTMNNNANKKEIQIDLSIVRSSISEELFSSCLCSSIEESDIIAEEVVNTVSESDEDARCEDELSSPEMKTVNSKDYATSVANALCDFLELDKNKAGIIARDAIQKGATHLLDGEANSTTFDSETDDDQSVSSPDEEVKEDEYFLQDQCCELCEREIPLTRHHLIPKSTWPRMRSRILNAADNPTKKKEKELIQSIFPLLPPKQPLTREYIRHFFTHSFASLCRQCHSMIHRVHDEMTLAVSFNTVDKLLEDENVVKFAKWANKQRVGSGARHRHPR